MFSPFILVTVTAASLLFFAQPLSAEEKSPAPAQQQMLKPKIFEMTDTEGTPIKILVTDRGIKLLDFKGKKALLMFYIYSGTPCRNELQLFTRLKPELRDLEFVAFELKGLKPDQLKAFAKELKLRGIHLIDTAQAMPLASLIARLTGWKGSVPLLIAIDAKGQVKHMQLGAMNEEELKKLIESL
ncbi:TlpA family protein disulfide reductase [Nitratifractor sp.]